MSPRFSTLPNRRLEAAAADEVRAVDDVPSKSTTAKLSASSANPVPAKARSAPHPPPDRAIFRPRPFRWYRCSAGERLRITPPSPRHADHFPGPLRFARPALPRGRCDRPEPLILHRKTLHQKIVDQKTRQEGLTRECRRQRVRELLRAVGMDESAMPRYPHEFSGGQRQRIGIARARSPCSRSSSWPMNRFPLLTPAWARKIVNLLQQLQRDFGLTYLLISHSMPVVRYLSTRIAVMYQRQDC